MSVVKYHNELNKVILSELDSKETDIFYTIIYKMKEKEIATFSIDEIKSFLDGHRSEVRFFNHLNKVFKTQLRIYKDSKIIDYHLFIRKELDLENKEISIRINPECHHILNNLISNYTKFELEEFINLKSEYSKKLFRLLMQYKDTGKAIFEIDKFKALLEIPINYRQSNIDQKVLTPIQRELKPIFKNFKIEKKKKGNFITHMIFSWKTEIEKVVKEKKFLLEDIPLYSKDLEELYNLCKVKTDDIKKLIFESLKKINFEIVKSNILYSNKNCKENYLIYLRNSIENDYAKNSREEKKEIDKIKNKKIEKANKINKEMEEQKKKVEQKKELTKKYLDKYNSLSLEEKTEISKKAMELMRTDGMDTSNRINNKIQFEISYRKKAMILLGFDIEEEKEFIF